MKFLTGFVTKHNRAVTAVFVLLAVAGALLMGGVGVKYDMISFLPPESNSTVALRIMAKEFAQEIPNTRVMVTDLSLTEAAAVKRSLSAIEGVTSVTWLDDVADVKMPLEYLGESVVSPYYRDGAAVFSVTIGSGAEADTIERIYDLIGEDGAVAGESVYRYSGQKLARGESSRAMMLAVPLILIILLLSTESWLEPLLFLSAIGAAVLINSGINFFLGEQSFVTNSISPILQLAVSLDYAIFLLHAFSDARGETDDARGAMRTAMRRAFPAIAASALTTIFGFAAMCFMKFRIGTDLGLNLIKGIILSYLSVMIFLPALTLCAYKLVDRAKHKQILPSFAHIGKVFAKIRIPALVIAVAVAVPCFLAQSKSELVYGTGGYDPSTRMYRDDAKITGVFGVSQPIAILVPRGEPSSERALARELAELPHILNVVSYAASADINIPPEIAGETVSALFYSDDYARIIAYTDTADEGDTAFATVEAVRGTVAKYYETSYSAGGSANLYDIKDTVQYDRGLISLIAILLCGAVILVTFRSLSLPVVLLLTIEVSIWINMSVPYFTGEPLSFIGYLVISTVQLGATVDYAILFADNYTRFRFGRGYTSARAVYLTYGKSFRSILISAATLALSGAALAIVSANPIVKTLGILLTRGTALSFIMVNCFLPAALIALDPVIRRTTHKRRAAGTKPQNKEETV
ncbi:MAG: MMPL family transporter [Oscillospiraceae bacterium]|jgi:predicted RND superfamily exporter protein|nr:MMPL family transporter [Oscillospiraceae bacterium]